MDSLVTVFLFVLSLAYLVAQLRLFSIDRRLKRVVELLEKPGGELLQQPHTTATTPQPSKTK